MPIIGSFGAGSGRGFGRGSGAGYIVATGGTITTCGDYKIHAFTSDGTFCVSAGSGPKAVVDYLVVAGGGGGGGRCNVNGGGGAGGFRIGAITVPGCAPALVAPGGIPVSIQAYPVTVGAGGAGGNIPPNPSAYLGAPGSNSAFETITSAGGGGGGSGNPAAPCGAYKNGGSGGGGADTQAGGSGNTPPTSPPQGNNGGNGVPNPSGRSPTFAGGGGGGAGSSGISGTTTKAGDGGNGSPVTDIFGASPKPFYAPTNGLYSGGGGGGYIGCASPPAAQGLGGSGGGGPSGLTNSPGVSGTINTGGGGGGAANSGPYTENGGNGASGVVLIRYKFQ